MAFDLVLAAVAASQTAAPPIPAVPPMAAVRMASREPGDIASSAPVPVTAVPVRVRVVAGTRQLFDDTLRVTRNASASYQESRSEAPEAVCSSDRYYSSQERYSLNINLYLRDDNPVGPAINVSVNWQRPSSSVACGGDGTRAVQLTQTVPLGAGQSATVQGDAGLTVTISR